MPDLPAFIDKWKHSGASERANFHSFLVELCDLLDLPRPDPATDLAARNDYTFERAVQFDDGEGHTSTGFIDLYKRGCFVMEAKQGSDAPARSQAEALGGAKPRRKTGTARRGTRPWQQAMERAKNQAHRYARSLPTDHGWPPLLIVVDIGYCFDLYADFSGQGKTYAQFPDAQRFRIFLDDLAGEAVRERLSLAWTDPGALDPTRRSARVTRRLAERLALLAASLEKEGHDASAVAHFLMRCLFTMFAEDVGLLPERLFTDLLERYRRSSKLDLFPKALGALWQTMDTGGFLPGLEADIAQFNSHLFHETDALTVSEAQLDLLVEAAQADWADVEPAIFGTLLERALDRRERHKLGAHFTPRAYVERLVMPALVEPLRAEWTAVQAAALAREAGGDERGAAGEIEAFHRRLCTVRVLDPACGSGNFLYVALEHLKRLEGEVLKVLAGYTGAQMLLGSAEALHEMIGGRTVTPGQLLGLEVNPRAAAIAEVVLWIGYLQWHIRSYGDASTLSAPILRDYDTIREQDALLAYDEKVPRLNAGGQVVTRWDGRTTKRHPATGRAVPDETARMPVYDFVNPRPAEWPEADFIVGNPPFIGNKRMRNALGDGYTEALRQVYRQDVPKSADFVMYWWHKAAEKARAGEAERFGLIATNSLTQAFNRRVLDKQMNSTPALSLAFAIPDHPWVDSADGAAVRISMTVGEVSDHEGRLMIVTTEEKTDELGLNVTLIEHEGNILPGLTSGTDFTQASPLKANLEVTNMGTTPLGRGFRLDGDDVRRLGHDVDDLPLVVKPYLIGRDILHRPAERYIIDFFGLSEAEARQLHPSFFQHILDHVKPMRAQQKRASYRDQWWIFAEARPAMRRSLNDLDRFIATCQTAKHRVFTFIDSSVLPDQKINVIGLDDAYYLGVLSSRIHVSWALANGGRHVDRPVYNNSLCFDPFPFPDATEAQKETIRTLAESLDAHRKDRLAAHEKLTMTAMYNVREKLRAGQPLTDKERTTHEQALTGVLQALHDDLDAAVAAAYGWPADLSDDQILERLVALNHERAAEEARGLIRYLRPEYQNPEGVAQAALDVEIAPAKKAAGKADRQPWPPAWPERIQAVQRALSAAGRPATARDLARRFHRAQTRQVQTLLETLEALGHVRRTEDGRFVA